jgi:Cu+-exporting ATPase
MALEPRVVSLDDADAPNPELDDMLRRLRVSAIFTAPLFLLAMSDLLPGAPVQHALSPTTLAWIQLALATPVVVWGARPFFERGWASIRRRSLNMFTLIALGTGVAYGYSVVATLMPAWIPAIGMHGVPLYFEAAAVITTLVLVGQVLGAPRAQPDGQRAPRPARPRAEDGPAHRGRRRRARRSARRRPGRRPPPRPAGREGSPSTGPSSRARAPVDESMVTGEPIPVEKAPGRERDRRHGQRQPAAS